MPLMRLYNINVLLILIWAISGCSTHKPINIFPPNMVGAWESDKYNWMIVFDNSGKIIKYNHMLAGPVITEDNIVYKEGPDSGTYMLFVMGYCESSLEDNHILTVISVVDHYELKFPHGELIGRTKDVFCGPISQNEKTWNAAWTSYGWLEGAKAPAESIIKENPIQIVFYKKEGLSTNGQQLNP